MFTAISSSGTLSLPNQNCANTKPSMVLSDAEISLFSDEVVVNCAP